MQGLSLHKPLFKAIAGTTICCFLLLIVQSGSSQDHRIPYLSDDLYGLADENMKIIVQPIYDEIRADLALRLVFAKKEGLWSILNWNGETIAPGANAYQTSSPYYQSYSDTTVRYIPGLICLTDKSSRRKYYFNRHTPPNTSLMPYVFIDDTRKNRPVVIDYEHPWQEIIKVSTPDGKINFIDTSANIIFPEGVYDGWVLSKHCISVDDGTGKFALFTPKAEQLTGYVFDKVKATLNPEYVIVEKKGPGSTDSYNVRYALLDAKGTVVAEHLKQAWPVDQEHVILTDSISSGLYTYAGKAIFRWPGCRLGMFGSRDTNYFIVQGKKYGVVNREGELLVDTIYESVMKQRPDKHLFHTSKGTVVYDSNFRPILKLDTLQIDGAVPSQEQPLTGHYQVTKKSSYKYGVIDSLGHVVVAPLYQYLRYVQSCRLFLVGNGNTYSALDFNGNLLASIESKKRDVTLRCQGDKMWMIADTISKVFDLIGTLQEQTSYDPNKRITGREELPLKDRTGKPVSRSLFEQMFMVTDEKGRRAVLIGRYTVNPFVSLFNEKGIEITPDEYGLTKNNTHNKTGSNGGITVFHKQDVLTGKNPFRTGVINFDGEWVIPPGYDLIRRVGGELYVTHNQNGSTLYNRYGKKISDKSYDFFEDDPNDVIHNDRIVVGYIQNKAEYDPVIQKMGDAKDFMKSVKESQALKNIKVLKGYINTAGEEVIKVQYSEAEPFQHVYTTVTGTDHKGEIYSSVIDLDGKEVLRTAYERLKLFHYDTTLMAASMNGKQGVIDLQGRILITPEYEEISTLKYPGVYVARDSTSKYLFAGSHKTPIGAGRIDEVEVTSSIFYVYFTHHDETANTWERKFHVFGTDGKYYGDFSSFFANSRSGFMTSYLFDQSLPEGYLTINTDKPAKPYIVSIKTQKAFRKE